MAGVNEVLLRKAFGKCSGLEKLIYHWEARELEMGTDILERKVNTSEHIVQRSSLPEALIREVSGQVVVEEEAAQVAPLAHCPDAAIDLASAQLILEHADRLSDQRVLAQRHQVRVVPVAEVCYTYKSHSSRFWVYGYENRVHAPDYPQKYCWGCCGIL